MARYDAINFDGFQPLAFPCKAVGRALCSSSALAQGLCEVVTSSHQARMTFHVSNFSASFFILFHYALLSDLYRICESAKPIFGNFHLYSSEINFTSASCRTIRVELRYPSASHRRSLIFSSFRLTSDPEIMGPSRMGNLVGVVALLHVRMDVAAISSGDPQCHHSNNCHGPILKVLHHPW